MSEIINNNIIYKNIKNNTINKITNKINNIIIDDDNVIKDDIGETININNIEYDTHTVIYDNNIIDDNNDNNEKDNNDNNEKDNNEKYTNNKNDKNDKKKYNNQKSKIKSNKNNESKKTDIDMTNTISIDEIDPNLKDMILSWMALDDKISQLNLKIKEIKDEKKQFENYILELMTQAKENVITTNKGVIYKNTKESKGQITQDIIQDTLVKILKDNDTAFICTNEIMTKRPIKKNINLKKKFKKIKKNDNN